MAPPPESAPAALPDDIKTLNESTGEIRGTRHLEALFERVENLLGGKADPTKGFFPRLRRRSKRPPDRRRDRAAGPEVPDAERLCHSREICAQIKLPFQIIEPLMKQWKKDQLVAYKGAAEMGDYNFTIIDLGREKARRYTDECGYNDQLRWS